MVLIIYQEEALICQPHKTPNEHSLTEMQKISKTDCQRLKNLYVSDKAAAVRHLCRKEVIRFFSFSRTDVNRELMCRQDKEDDKFLAMLKHFVSDCCTDYA